jgi:hypothetical protein
MRQWKHMIGAWTQNTTAVVASNVERSKCGRVIFSVSGEGDVYSIERERERERDRDFED